MSQKQYQNIDICDSPEISQTGSQQGVANTSKTNSYESGEVRIVLPRRSFYWNEECKIVEYDKIKLNSEIDAAYRYQIKLKYFNGKKNKTKVIKFGLKKIEYPLETGNNKDKLKILRHLRDYETPLKPSFYVRNYLLFDSIEQAEQNLEIKLKNVVIY